MKERVDDIGFGGYKLIQHPEQFCYGIDAVLLADFAAAKQTDSIADLGTGTGVIPLIIHHKSGAKKIVGIEKQREAFELACRNAMLNKLSDAIRFIHGDVVDVKKYFRQGEFSLVVSNPPYTEKGTGPTSPYSSKEEARHETTAGVVDFIKAAQFLLAPKGSFCLVHRPSRLVDIIAACRELRLEPKRLKLVSPFPGAAPNIMLLQCIKNGGKELIVEPTLFIRSPNGLYSSEVNKIYEREKE